MSIGNTSKVDRLSLMNLIVRGAFWVSVASPVIGLIATYLASRHQSGGIASQILPAIPHLLVTSPYPRFTGMLFLIGAFSFIAVVNTIHRRLSRRNRRENGWALVILLVSGSVLAFTLAGLVTLNVNRSQSRCALNLAAFTTAATIFHFTIDRIPQRPSRAVAWSKVFGFVIAGSSVLGVVLFVASNGHPGAAYALSAASHHIAFFSAYAKLGFLGLAVFGGRTARSGDGGDVNDDPFAYRTA
jgi:hypothetical protein